MVSQNPRTVFSYKPQECGGGGFSSLELHRKFSEHFERGHDTQAFYPDKCREISSPKKTKLFNNVSSYISQFPTSQNESTQVFLISVLMKDLRGWRLFISLEVDHGLSDLEKLGEFLPVLRVKTHRELKRNEIG